MIPWQMQLFSPPVTEVGSQELKLMTSNNEMNTLRIKSDQMKQTGDEYSQVQI
jgi:hypothetical protein